MTEEAPITMAEARDAGYCAAGQRRWLRANVPNWREYLRDGVPIEEARKMNAQLVQQVLKLREARKYG